MKNRIILHIDQNCYFASVEMIYHPEYRNVPMAVVGDAKLRHGIILAKNQLASDMGVKTAETIGSAESKCPNLVKAQAHYDKYQFYSRKLKQMYLEYTDKVESFGLDECWLDMTGILSSYDEAYEFANSVKQRVKDEFKLTCSIGVSFNKIFAKLGSDMKKPDATTLITPDNFKEKVWPLSAKELLFVGKNTGDRLSKINIKTIGDLAHSDKEFLMEYMGKAGEYLWIYANGLDDSPVADIEDLREVKSVGNSTTTSKDMSSTKEVEATFRMLSGKVSYRLRKHNLIGNTIQITVKDRNFNTYEHQKILFEATSSEKIIYEEALKLFNESYDWHTAVRLLGIRVTNLISGDSGVQMSIFSDFETKEKESKLNKAIDDINMKFGSGTIKAGGELKGNQK